MYTITTEDPRSPEASILIDALSATLTELTGDSGRSSFDPTDVQGDRARFVVARTRDGVPVGCGAFRPMGDSIAEIKRMYAVSGTFGVGSAVLAHLESEAKILGFTQLWLETRLVNERAISFYERHGYSRIANFGKYIGRSEAVCFGKSLVFQPPPITLRPPSINDLAELMAFEFENRAYFEQRINARPASYYSGVGVEAAIQQAIDDANNDKAYQFLVRDTTGELVGRVNLSRIRRKHFHSADLGYRVAEAHTGKGVAKQSVKSVIEIAFNTLNLQRVEAVTMITNYGSIAVLKFNGFDQFGLSQQSFELGGTWHDSLHFDCRRDR